MNAPDKIYVKEFGEGMSSLWSRVKLPKTTAIAQHEYIRKDALLEWAKERLDFACALKSEGQKTVCKEFIDKIESL